MAATLINWNCNGIWAHYEDLQALLRKHDPLICTIQEPNLRPDHKFTLRPFKLYHKAAPPSTRVHGGALLAVHQRAMSEQVPLQTPLQAIAAKILLKPQITICSIYLPPSEAISRPDMESLLSQLPQPFLICGDFNAHHPAWHSRLSTSRGKQIEEIIRDFSLLIHNPEAPTHYSAAHNSWSSIDLVLSSASLQQQLVVHTHEDLAGSDHVPLIVKLPYSSPPWAPPTKTWNFKTADWDAYNLCFSSLLLADPPPDTPEEWAPHFLTKITQAAEAAIPQVSKGGRRPGCSLPWWNINCTLAIRARRKALKRLKAHPSPDNLTLFRQSKAKAKAKQVLKSTPAGQHGLPSPPALLPPHRWPESGNWSADFGASSLTPSPMQSEPILHAYPRIQGKLQSTLLQSWPTSLAIPPTHRLF
jgi:exonuclease III